MYKRKVTFTDGFEYTFTDYSKRIQEKAKLRTLVTQHGRVCNEYVYRNGGSNGTI